MGDVMVDALVTERDGLLSRIQHYKDSATERGTDLSDDDLSSIGTAKERIAQIDKRLEVIGDDLALPDDTRDKLARVTQKVAPAAAWRSAGEAVWDLLHFNEPDSRNRYASALRRAAEHMGQDKAETVPVAGDLAGLYVSPVVGPVIRPQLGGMPFLNGIGSREMPAAFSFTRPYLIDTNADTGVGQQGSGGTLGFQKAELPSKAFEIDADTLKATTIGGYLNVSQQLISLQPGSLQVIIDQLRWRVARALDAHALTEAQLSTGHIELADNAPADDVLQAFYDASVAVYMATGMPADWVAMGPQGWARLGGLTDLAGRPMLPWLGASNAIGSMSAGSLDFAAGPAGLRPIVTPGIDDTSYMVGNGLGIEVYTYSYPVLEAVEPSVLGRQVAVAASIVAHRPTPTENSIVTISDTTP